MVERDRERRQKEFDKKVKSNSDLFNEDTDSESENFEPRKIKYKSRKTLDSSDSEGNKVGCVFPMVISSDFRTGRRPSGKRAHFYLKYESYFMHYI